MQRVNTGTTVLAVNRSVFATGVGRATASEGVCVPGDMAPDVRKKARTER